MATLVFTCNKVFSNNIDYPRLLIYHGDNIKISAWKHHRYVDFSGRKCCDYREKDPKYPIIDVPSYSEMKDDNHPKNLEIETWAYDIEDTESEEKYKPLYISYPSDEEYWKLSDMFEIPTFDELIKFVEKTNIYTFVVKSGIDLYVTLMSQNMHDSFTMTKCCLTIGKPHVKIEKRTWADRFTCHWKRICKGDPTRYKKEFNVEVLYGDNDMNYVGFFGPVTDTYSDVDEQYNNYEPIRYSRPYLTPESVKEERRKAEEYRQQKLLEAEMNKLKDGYCDHCGCENAKFIQNPYGYTGWLCPSCYRIEYCYWDD